jgi:hypothetical protein
MADKDKQPQQKDFDKAWDNMKKGKGRLPYEDDMGPLPTKEEADMARINREKAMIKGATEGMGGKSLGMKKGGKVSQLAKANGIAVRGKSRGKIC